MEYLFKNYKKIAYYSVIGFILASIIAIPISIVINISNINFNILEILVGIVCLLIGAVISYLLGEKDS